jgi:ATP-dependent Lhr-like helicase
MQAGEAEFYEIVCQEASREFAPMELVYPKEVPVFEKYDEYVPPELVRKGFALGVLDVNGMKKRVLTWRRYGGTQDEQ